MKTKHIILLLAVAAAALWWVNRTPAEESSLKGSAQLRDQSYWLNLVK